MFVSGHNVQKKFFVGIKEWLEQKEINSCRILFWILSILATSQILITLILFSQYLNGPIQKISTQRTLEEIQEDFSRSKARKQLRGESRTIPRVLHQVQSNNYNFRVSSELAQSWAKCGNFTQIGFYNPKEIVQFVHQEYPEYGYSFSQLKSQKEREIIFKFLVVYRYGGFYAGPQMECMGKIDAVIGSTDSMVVGWEGEASSHGKAVKQGLVKKRQLVTQIFAASRGHPVLKEVVEELLEQSEARNDPQLKQYNRYQVPQNLDLQRESISLFTDVVMKHITQHPPNVTTNPWTVAVLPTIAFGTNFTSKPVVPGVFVAKRIPQNKKFLNFNLDSFSNLKLNWYNPPSIDRTQAEYQHYPVTILQNPPFTQMTNLLQQGDNQSNFDVNQQITQYGNFQWGMPYHARPTLLQVLLGSLESLSANTTTFVDIGAGIGFTSLGAAARGHPVVAFEASHASLQSFQHSIEYNGFQSLIKVVEKPVRSKHGEQVCVQRNGEFKYLDRADNDLMHGYGDPLVHASDISKCLKNLESVRVDELLSVNDPDLFIGALKITVNGWEGHVLESMEQLLHQKTPKSVFITFSFGLLEAAGYPDPKKILVYMHALGYQKIGFSGLKCTSGRGKHNVYQQKIKSEENNMQHQHTWCWLRPDHFDEFIERTSSRPTEIFNLLFIWGDATSQQGQRQGQDQG